MTQPATCGFEGVSTVFIFDWDDTLLPSAALSHIEERLWFQALREVDNAAARVLSIALATPQSHVQLLTNAEEGWVWTSAQHMPRVQQLLLAGKISLLSAHPHLELVPGETEEATARRRCLLKRSSTEWKDIAVRERLAGPLCEAIRGTRPSSVQVLTVGDQAHDMEAGRTLAEFFRQEVQHVSVKVVRMQEKPTVLELTAELSTLATSLPALCGKAGDLVCSLAKNGPGEGRSSQVEQVRSASRQVHESATSSRHLSQDAKRSKLSITMSRMRAAWTQMSHCGSA